MKSASAWIFSRHGLGHAASDILQLSGIHNQSDAEAARTISAPKLHVERDMAKAVHPRSQSQRALAIGPFLSPFPSAPLALHLGEEEGRVIDEDIAFGFASRMLVACFNVQSIGIDAPKLQIATVFRGGEYGCGTNAAVVLVLS